MALLAVFLYPLINRGVTGAQFNSLPYASFPRQSLFFIYREEPMRQMVEGLLGNNNAGQRIMGISGMGGSGKSQLAIYFAQNTRNGKLPMVTLI